MLISWTANAHASYPNNSQVLQTHTKKKDHPPKGKKQAKKQKTEESLKHSLLYLSYTLICGYLFAYFWICISPHFQNFPALRSEIVYFCILLLFNLLVYCSLLRSLPRLPVSSFKHTVASSWLLHLKTQDLRRSDWAFPTHRWLKMLFELSDFFLKAHGMFNYVDISGLQCL